MDHGGEERFRMSATETLEADQLAGWLDTWQNAVPGRRITVIYEACQSGSFMNALSAPDRTIITSASGEENAYFVSQGTLSFSNLFFSNIFTGQDLRTAFDEARQATTEAFSDQNPLINTDGDLNFNEPEDLAAVENVFIGNGTDTNPSRPTITAVSPPQTLTSGNSAVLRAEGVSDPDGLGRVFAVIRPPGFNPGSPDNPVNELPQVTLLPVGNGDFEATFDQFSEFGTYQISFHALDAFGTTAIPRRSTVSVQNPLKRRAVVIAGDSLDNAEAFERVATLAVDALSEQGYGPDGTACADSTCDDIRFLIGAGLEGVDGSPVKSNVEFAITQWGTDQVQDLTIFVVGESDNGGIRLTDTETLQPQELSQWLTTVEQQIPGTVTLIIDGDNAGGFIGSLGSSPQRITVASSGSGEPAVFRGRGTISFSSFFWNQTLDGATVGRAHQIATSAVNFGPRAQSPELDGNGNGVPNEFSDSIRPGRYSIGSGILLAGDDPIIASISAPASIRNGQYALQVSDVTTTSQIQTVTALVLNPDGTTTDTELAETTPGTYQATLTDLDEFNPINTEISVFAEDIRGGVSLPIRTTATGDVLFAAGFE